MATRYRDGNVGRRRRGGDADVDDEADLEGDADVEDEADVVATPSWRTTPIGAADADGWGDAGSGTRPTGVKVDKGRRRAWVNPRLDQGCNSKLPASRHADHHKRKINTLRGSCGPRAILR